MIKRKTLSAALLTLLLGFSATMASALTVSRLQVQQLHNPVGLDQDPQFSWVISSAERSVRQVSYRIVVSRDADGSDVEWDSGEVESEQSTFVTADHSFAASTRYYWRVTVKDNHGEAATSDEKAYFETGLKDTGWSGAKWVKMTDEPLGYVDETAVSDYTIEADFEIEDVAAGICFGVQDSSNFYM